MNSFTKEHQESYKNAKICNICKENFENKYLKSKKKSASSRSLSLYWRI